MLKRFNSSFSLLASCVFLDYIISSAKNPSPHQENELFLCQLAGIGTLMSFADVRYQLVKYSMSWFRASQRENDHVYC